MFGIFKMTFPISDAEIKFCIYVTDTIGHSRVQPSLLGEDRESGGNRAYLSERRDADCWSVQRLGSC